MTLKYLLPLLCLAACAADSPPPSGDGFTLAFPVDCTLGDDCRVMNYADHDARKGEVTDAACGARAYDGHKGTDIAVRDWSVAQSGVAILAPAAGKVLGVRDGESDQFPDAAKIAQIKARGRECGNGVRLQHANGYTTQFCHMKKGSVAVALGDSVEAGAKLGEIGMSGITEHPHMHMTLMRDDAVIDPFTGRQTSQPCGLDDAAPLWAGPIPYTGFSLYDAGFTPGRPDFDALARGKGRAEPGATSPALVFFATYFGALPGDKVELIITRPDGSEFARQTITQKNTKARQSYFAGRKNSKGRFMPGAWNAKAVITRPDTGERQDVSRTITFGD